MRKELFEFHHVSKLVGGHKALRNLSLRLYQDEITFLVGRSSSGRSALTRLMMGELAPDSGTMTLLEEPYQPLSPRQAHERGGFCVTQDTTLIQNLSISENIYIARPVFPVWRRGQARAFAQMMCRECGIQMDLHQKPTHAALIDTLLVYCPAHPGPAADPGQPALPPLRGGRGAAVPEAPAAEGAGSGHSDH